MGKRIALFTPVVVLMAVLSASPPAHADVAPYKVQCGGATGVLRNQTDMQMQAFLVDITVNLPIVHEVVTYLPDNPTNHIIKQSVIIPITSTPHTSTNSI